MFPILFLICLDSANRKISKTGSSESSAVSRQVNKVLLHQGTIDALRGKLRKNECLGSYQ